MKGQRGSVLVKVALMAVVLMGMAAISVDVGVLTVHKRTIQAAADLAAMAGVQKLPEDPAGAVAAAEAYLADNGVTGSDGVAITTEESDHVLVVNVSRTAPLYFARVLGHDTSTLPALAKARVTAKQKYPDLVPWGVPITLCEVGAECELKLAAGKTAAGGNFQVVYLDSHMNGPEYQDWVANGYDGLPISVGDWLYTKPGNLGSNTPIALDQRFARAAGYDCTLPDYDPDCPLLVTSVMVDDYDKGKDEVQVMAFGKFLLTSYYAEKGTGLIIVKGIYLGPIDASEFDPLAMNKQFYLVK